MLARQPRTQEPFEQVREPLRQGLRQSKQRILLGRAQRDLRAQYHVRLEPGAVQALFARYNDPKDTIRVGAGRIPVPKPPTPAEAQRVLARYDGADGKPVAYSLGDAVQDLRDPTKTAPNLMMTTMIEQWLQNVLLQRIALLEARRRHLTEEPSVVRQARAQVDNALMQAAYNALVVEGTTVNEDDIHADFVRRAPQLTRLQAATLKLVTFADSAVASRVAAAALESAGLEAAVRAAGGTARVVEQQVHFPTTDPLWSRIERSLGGMRPGQVSGALPMGRGWLLFQLVSRQDAPLAYEKLEPGVKQALQADLAKLPWPVPPAAGSGA